MKFLILISLLLFSIPSFAINMGYWEEDGKGGIRPMTNKKKIQELQQAEKYSYEVNGSGFLSGVYGKRQIFNFLYPNELMERIEVHKGITNIFNACSTQQREKLNMPRYRSNILILQKNYTNTKNRKKGKNSFSWQHGKKYQECFNNMYCQNYSAYKGIGRKMPKQFYSRIKKDCAKYVMDH